MINKNSTMEDCSQTSYMYLTPMKTVKNPSQMGKRSPMQRNKNMSTLESSTVRLMKMRMNTASLKNVSLRQVSPGETNPTMVNWMEMEKTGPRTMISPR